MPRVSFVCAIVVLALPYAGSAAAQTLNEALAKAYANNPTLAAQQARLRQADEAVPQALSNWRPTVQFNSDVGYRRLTGNPRSGLGNNEAVGNQTLNPRSYGASVQQPIYRGGRTLSQTRAAENSVRAERSRLTAIEQAVLFDAASAFNDVLRDQAIVELTIANEQRLGRQLQATRDRFQVGEVTRTDVFQAEARLSRATAERVGAEGVLEQSRAVYRNVVGELPGKLVRPPVPQDLPKSLQESIERSIGANPTIAAVEYDERTALDVVDSVRGELLPTVSLIGSAEQIWEENREGVRLDDLQATVRVTVPIYQSGVVYSRLRESKQVVAEQRKLLDQARRDAVESATTAWSALETARAQLVSLTKEVEANTVALEGVQREAEVGARTVLDILDAEQELLDSQVRLVGAERDEVVASYQLKSALGELTARRLGLQVDFYDPDRHYNEVRNRWFGGCSEGDICTDFNAPASAD